MYSVYVECFDDENNVFQNLQLIFQLCDFKYEYSYKVLMKWTITYDLASK